MFSSLDIQELIPEFKGKSDPDKFLNWLYLVEGTFKYGKVSEEVKVKLVAKKLTRQALVWWKQVQYERVRKGKKKIKEWEKMRAKMKEKFLPPLNAHLVEWSVEVSKSWECEKKLRMKKEQPAATKKPSSKPHPLAKIPAPNPQKSPPSSTQKSAPQTQDCIPTPKAPRKCFRCHDPSHLASNCPNQRLKEEKGENNLLQSAAQQGEGRDKLQQRREEEGNVQFTKQEQLQQERKLKQHEGENKLMQPIEQQQQQGKEEEDELKEENQQPEFREEEEGILQQQQMRGEEEERGGIQPTWSPQNLLNFYHEAAPDPFFPMPQLTAANTLIKEGENEFKAAWALFGHCSIQLGKIAQGLFVLLLSISECLNLHLVWFRMVFDRGKQEGRKNRLSSSFCVVHFSFLLSKCTPPKFEGKLS